MPESDFQINGFSSGASAATAMFTEEISAPIEVNAVTAVSSAATSTAVAPDVTKNGTSIFAQQVGTVYQGSTAQGSTGGLDASQTSFDFVPTDKLVEKNSVITIDTEQMVVTNVAGSPSQTSGGTGVQRLTVTRGANGSTPAVHAAGAAVVGAKPVIASGGTATPTGFGLPVPVRFNVGDVLAIVGATGATNLSVSLDVLRV